MTKKKNEPKDIATEQHDLSMLLCKLLYTVYKRVDLDIEQDGSSVVSAYAPEETHLYDIWCEKIYDQTSYWIRVQNGERRMVEFGRRSNDGTSFSDQEHNYLEALYNLRRRKNYVKRKQSETAIKTKLALSDLENKTPRPDLKSFDAWGEERIKVLLYLKQLTRVKKQ